MFVRRLILLAALLALVSACGDDAPGGGELVVRCAPADAGADVPPCDAGAE